LFFIGQGRLKFAKGYAMDGVVYFRVWSPRLRRIMGHTYKRDLSVVGKWFGICDIILWFKKIKQ